MHFTIERASLLAVLNHVHTVVERRNTIPILSNVLINAADNQIQLTATDMDLTVEEQAAASVLTEGGTTLSAHMLYDIVRRLPDGTQVELKVETENQRCKVSAGRSTFELPTLPREDFPMIRHDDLTQKIAIKAGDLKTLIDRTKFAISTEETRYYLNGIYLESFDADGVSSLRAVATDGHRLAKCEIPMELNGHTVSGVIIPRKTVGELAKLVEGKEDALELSVSETKIRIKKDSMTLTSKLIDGTFPDYQRVIPSNNDKTLTVDPGLLNKAVDRVSVVSTDRSRGVKFSLSEAALGLQSSSAEMGTANEEIEASYTGDQVSLGFNAKYLTDILGQVGGDAVIFHLSDSASPVLVQNPSDDQSVFVLMPMRV